MKLNTGQLDALSQLIEKIESQLEEIEDFGRDMSLFFETAMDCPLCRQAGVVNDSDGLRTVPLCHNCVLKVLEPGLGPSRTLTKHRQACYCLAYAPPEMLHESFDNIMAKHELLIINGEDTQEEQKALIWWENKNTLIEIIKAWFEYTLIAAKEWRKP